MIPDPQLTTVTQVERKQNEDSFLCILYNLKPSMVTPSLGIIAALATQWVSHQRKYLETDHLPIRMRWQAFVNI